jgi:tetratricopeptide (TPR) repeat protein
MLGRVEEAIPHHDKALAINPDYASPRNSLGNALQSLGRSEEAIAQYEKTLALRPSYIAISAGRTEANSPNACCGPGNLRRLGGSYVRAVQSLASNADRIVDKMPSNLEFIKMPSNLEFVGLTHLALPNARIILAHHNAGALAGGRRDPILNLSRAACADVPARRPEISEQAR